jgi:methionine synthase reductase
MLCNGSMREYGILLLILFLIQIYVKIPLTASLKNTHILIFVSSTTGDGDSPDNALKFWRYLRKISKEGDISTRLKDLSYTVLGLGDTNYSNFGAHPKKIVSKFKDLGCKLFYPSVVADEVEGLENVVDPWIEGLWPELEKFCEKTSASNISDSSSKIDISSLSESVKMIDLKKAASFTALNISLPYPKLESLVHISSVSKIPAEMCKVEFGKNQVSIQSWEEKMNEERGKTNLNETFTKQKPFYSQIKRARCMTSKAAVKRCILVELDITGMRWDYSPGDSIGIVCPNDDMVVHSLCKRLKLDHMQQLQLAPLDGDGAELFPDHIPRSTSVYELFKYSLDITSTPSKYFFRMLAEYCSDLDEKKMLLFLCSKQGLTDYKQLLSRMPSVLDVLLLFKSTVPPISRLIDTLLQLRPRYYSICTSNISSPDTIQITFNIAEYQINDSKDTRFGLCTSWLNYLCGNPEFSDDLITLESKNIFIPIFANPSHDFHLPSDQSSSIIMVGPGTGVAPFIGFLKQRYQLSLQKKKLGSAWLFTGFRNQKLDYLFEKELNFFHNDAKILDNLIVAFSRDGSTDEESEELKYVQHHIMKYGKEIISVMLYNNDSKFYICGDANGMAKEVNQTLISILCKHGELTNMEAVEKISVWKKEKRLLMDIWS